MPGNAIIQEIIGNKTTIRNNTQINKLAGKSGKEQKKQSSFCYIFATKTGFVVFF